MENNCSFVCSRGLLKSCDFHSDNPQSSSPVDVNHIYKMLDGNNMFDKMSIYVCTDVLPYFINVLLPNIKNTFYLISGDSDATVPGGSIYIGSPHEHTILSDVCFKLINNPLLIKWYAQNCVFDHPKVCQLPIGMDYHTISNDPSKFWRDKEINEGTLPRHQEMILKNIRSNMKPFHERICSVLITTNFENNSCKIPSELVTNDYQEIPRTRLWKKMVQYTFIYSPYKSGMDCHRHWESLLLGCIPIMQSIGTNEMFEDLPVLIVKNYSDVTKELLENTIEEFKSKKINYDKLLLKYWVDLFTN